MKITNRKLIVFILIHITLTLFLMLCILKAADQLQYIGSTIIYCMIFNGFGYVGGNVFHAWQKSKHFNKDIL